MLQLMQ